MSRDPIPTHSFALVIVRHPDGRFLLVQERKHGQGWYLPAGRVDPGERFVEAALRETLEESGLAVEVTGLVRIEQQPTASSQRLRVFFVARPVDPSTPPKAVADAHSLGAAWFTLDELASLPLRGDEVRAWCSAVAQGRVVVAPLSLLTDEGERP
jgi:phosphatase NudJ